MIFPSTVYYTFNFPVSLAEQDENELERFLEKKRALDQRTKNLQRYKLHPLLRDSSLVDTMASLCQADNDFSHLSVADQRLMSTMPMLKDEDFSGSEVRESTYNVSDGSWMVVRVQECEILV